MTGTADTEAEEFAKIYKLDVTVVPTNRALIRVNNPDVVYKTEREKFDAVVEEITELPREGPAGPGGHGVHREVGAAVQAPQEARGPAPGAERQVPRARGGDRGPGRAGEGGDHRHQHGRPRHRHPAGGNPDFLAKEILRKSGLDPGDRVRRRRARRRWQEARQITEPEHERVVELGGLHILGTERHESRRIDNQLRGRSGRQGDPGSSRFYLSLEDDLLRIFGSERIQKIMDRLGMEEGEPIEHRLVTRAIGTAQKRVETHNFEIRKHLLEYDDVMNKQREIVYGHAPRDPRGREPGGDGAASGSDELVDGHRRHATRPRTRTRRTGTWAGSTRPCTGSSTSSSRPTLTAREVASREALRTRSLGEAVQARYAGSARPELSTASSCWIARARGTRCSA